MRERLRFTWANAGHRCVGWLRRAIVRASRSNRSRNSALQENVAGETFTVTIRFATYRSFMYRKADHVGLLSPDADA